MTVRPGQTPMRRPPKTPALRHEAVPRGETTAGLPFLEFAKLGFSWRLGVHSALDRSSGGARSVRTCVLAIPRM
jgi:hypothetical protein